MNKIKRVSLFFRILFQLTFVILPMMQIVGWIYAPASLHLLQNTIVFGVIPKAYYVLHHLDVIEKLSGFLISLIPTGIDLFILYSLIKLFRLYEKGEIFSIKNVNYLRNIGIALLISQLINPIYEFLMGIVLTWRNPPGYRFAAMTLNQTNIGIILIALMFILISWIMAEGCKLNEEQQLTI